MVLLKRGEEVKIPEDNAEILGVNRGNAEEIQN